MKTIEDVLGYIDTRKKELEDIIDRCQYAGADFDIPDNRLQEILYLESKIKESQMELTDEDIKSLTAKPFDIDRCLNEDGGRCIHLYDKKEALLLSKIKNVLDVMSVLKKGMFHGLHESELQNIPRGQERWFNFELDSDGEIKCSHSNGFETKDLASKCRSSVNDYIGDPICISSEEV